MPEKLNLVYFILSIMIRFKICWILVNTETKLDNTFPTSQFLVDGFYEPIRLDRNRNGGGIMIFVREDIPSKLLQKHSI